MYETRYNLRIKIMKPGTTYITTSSGIWPLLVANELIFAPEETRQAKLFNDSKGKAFLEQRPRYRKVRKKFFEKVNNTFSLNYCLRKMQY